MYTVASYLVEVLSNESYADFLKKRFWNPLEMHKTYHDLCGVEAANATEHLSYGYRWDEKTNSFVHTPSFSQPEGQGAGLIYSSVSDIAKWVRSMIKGTGPLNKGIINELVKPRAIIRLDDDEKLPFYSHTLYALGLFVGSYRSHEVVGHTGSVPGFNSLMQWLLEKEWGVVIMGNSQGASDVADILFSYLADELLDVSVSDRVDWPTLWREREKI